MLKTFRAAAVGPEAAACRVLLLLGMALLAAGCSTTLSPLPSRESRSYHSILEWSHRNGMPGAVLLVRTPRTNFLGSIGLADVKQQIPMRTDHAFRIGSITKTFVGMVAAQLQAEGRLDTEAVITNYLPDSITRRISTSDQITVQQLLRHQSGIYNCDSSWRYGVDRWLFFRRSEWPPSRMLEYSLGQPAVFPPGTEFSYSNPNYILAGLIIDRITSSHHAAEIRRRILDPLQLTNTFYEHLEPPRGELAHGYQRLFGSQDTLDWTPVTGGGAGLVSTVSDLALFIRAVAATNGLMDTATANPRRPSWRTVQRYDFGLEAARPRAGFPWVYGHRGIQPGYLCLAWHDPENDITVVFFGNSSHLNVVNTMHTAWNFYATLESAVFEQALVATRGTTAVLPPVCAPRSDSELQGEWVGTVRSAFSPFAAMRLKARITEKAPGQFHAELDNETEARNCQPASVTFHRPEVEVVVQCGAGEFRGRLNEENTAITGHWISHGRATRATFVRAPGTADPPKRLAGKETGE